MLAASRHHLRPKVLVVDDEHLIADTLSQILEMDGFEVSTAYRGEAAVEAARFWNPDIFLADIVMPGLNGIDAALRIRALCPACRIFLLTGLAGIADLLHQVQERSYNFEVLAKPIHPTQLLAVLRSNPQP